ncbi:MULTISPECIES: hypothetical protein [Methylosinus]|uniref:Uncharacterized protein n=1 Tax=Methylosinus trichosporium (strain ATCC 35070 / NCIMB 11131 / UNIQEM 75 / OB3b) TaxID=595536 RepID=A0A2D2CYD5_METT3|nr:MULTISPECIES: hypothetical protein [Methylosinus]ATQ67751.1 hypothetical protein CQW49_07485 [Methylosinus trichosporium OB3b]OBS51142.1 hypothetical protein A8B73_17620 [Methylosinus sp. 3S-1]
MTRRFTAEEDARLLALRKQFPGGKGRGGVVDIAAIMERQPSSVSARLRHLGQKAPARRKFTPEEDARLLALHAEHPSAAPRKGETYSHPIGARKIAALMQRPVGSIQSRLKKIEGRQA